MAQQGFELGTIRKDLLSSNQKYQNIKPNGAF